MGTEQSRQCLAYHESSSDAPFPRSWMELTEWCREATELSSLLADTTANERERRRRQQLQDRDRGGEEHNCCDEDEKKEEGPNGDVDGDDNRDEAPKREEEEEGCFPFRRFLPMVHRELVVGSAASSSRMPPGLGPAQHGGRPGAATATARRRQRDCCYVVPPSPERIAGGPSGPRQCGGSLSFVPPPVAAPLAFGATRPQSHQRRRKMYKCGVGGTAVGEKKDASRVGARIADDLALSRWSFETMYKRKVLILAERPPPTTDDRAEGRDDDCRDYWEATYGVPATTIARTMPFVRPSPCEFLTVGEFVRVVALLRGLRQSLLTGCRNTVAADGPGRREVIHADDTSPGDGEKIPGSSPEDEDDDDDDEDDGEPGGDRTPRRQTREKDVAEEREGEGECIVCMDRTVEVVLPCAHGFCDDCARGWVVEHGGGDCPVCRGELTTSEFEGEHWRLETWSTKDIADHVQDIETRLQAMSLSLTKRTRARDDLASSFDEFLDLVAVTS